MTSNVMSDPWLWLSAAGFFTILLGVLIYKQRHPMRQEAGQAEGGSWVPTGRIDFQGPTHCDPDSVGNFQLQAEETRTVCSIGGLAHHEIRWRRARLNEAKKVVVAYHEARNLRAAPAPGQDQVRETLRPDHAITPVTA